MITIRFPLSLALIRYFADGHYMEFIALVQAGVISHSVANDWLWQIGQYLGFLQPVCSEAKKAA